MQFREQWLWNKLFLKLYIALPAITAIALIPNLYPEYGLKSFYFLLFIPTGTALWFIYTNIGKKVTILMKCKSAQNGEAVESLLVIGKKQSPGIAILREDVLILIPIIGRRRKYKLESIRSIKKDHWLPGKFLWGKMVFHLQTSSATTIAFAVPESVGKRWYEQLTKQT